MSSKLYSKAENQLKNKPAKWAKFLKHNKPKTRSCGKARFSCNFTGAKRGVIRSYGLQINRRVFRLNAKKLGFRKLD